MLTSPLVARVHLIDAPYHADKSYDYYITAEMRGSVAAGCFVKVPFGGGNRRRAALVVETLAESDFPIERMKPVEQIINESVTLNSEMLGLCAFMKEQTFCTVGDAVRTILPPQSLSKLIEYYKIAAPLSGGRVTDDMMTVYNFISRVGEATDSRIRDEAGDSAPKAIAALLLAGAIERGAEVRDGSRSRYIYYAQASENENPVRPRGKKQAAIIDYLCGNGKTTFDRLKSELAATPAQLKALCDAGHIEITQVDSYRDPYGSLDAAPPDGNILSDEQESAAQTLKTLFESGEAKAALLHGVTGSGKTRVIKRMIDTVRESGRSVIMLIPEISLTPQTVAFFRSYYGDKVCVLHSALSAGERFDAWRRMKKGEVDVCVGTRSAVFAPFDNIGMIVIDEEQESTYKSDMTPRYHARDIARYRCANHHALMLLASATPSLESYYKAESGIYTLVELKNRYGLAVIPEAHICDVREDTGAGDMSALGHVLRGELEKNLVSGEQSVLFLNRRGYNHFLSCPMCGEVITCPHCSVSLTYHTAKNAGGYLVCHYCGYRAVTPQKCPKCGSEHIRYMGFGTQKVEEELHKSFPAARVMRMDADTTSTKFSYDTMLAAFRDGEYDILLGTQMVAKGHDFPRVTLVGVLSADMSLYLDDYRSSERTFDLITQVVGRAGRASDGSLSAGRAVIQTFSPEHPVLRFAAAQDYKSFYQNEIALRRTLMFPPFCDIISVTLTGDVENELAASAEYFARRLGETASKRFSDVQIAVFGPIEPYLYKLQNKFRLKFVVKCVSNKRTRELMRMLLRDFGETMYKKISIAFDINPSNL
ncbi:MAG: primosomal protein N' [Eubacteriales bacterium]